MVDARHSNIMKAQMITSYRVLTTGTCQASTQMNLRKTETSIRYLPHASLYVPQSPQVQYSTSSFARSLQM
jgi:hypothetical protein